MRGLAASAAAGALWAALAVAGCGVGPGEEAGTVELRVTRDHGAEEIAGPVSEEVDESDTVLRLLDRNADVETRYGGGFVQSVEGIEGGREDGRLVDWFYSVNGVEPALGAAEYELSGGDRVWWDHRDWTSAMRMPANVGAFPEPFLNGYEGERHPVVLECFGGPACATAERALTDAGVVLARRGSPAAIRVLAGPWAAVRTDEAVRVIERGPAVSGVFADFVPARTGWRLALLDERGREARLASGSAPLVAALRAGEDPPVWVVTGTDRRGAAAAAALLDEGTLLGKYAAGPGGKALPVR